MMNARCRRVGVAVLTAAGLIVSTRAPAFDGHRVQDGPYTLEIADVPGPEMLDAPIPVRAGFRNGGGRTVAVRLHLHGLADSWHPVGPEEAVLEVGPGQDTSHTFRIAVSSQVYRALYPVWVTAEVTPRDNDPRSLRAVRVFASDIEADTLAAGAPPPDDEPLTLHHVLRLEQSAARIVWRYFDRPELRRPTGWWGQDSASGAAATVGDVDRSGDRRPALQMHPPWRGGKGTIFTEYSVALPDAAPLTLTFANAIRDHTDAEPPSDGVTFRVWASDAIVFERHTADKAWLDGRADLTPWAGQTIRLRLESHPGPDRDTTCDSSYWAEPTLWAGPIPTPRSEEAWQTDLLRGRNSLLGPDPASRFDLGDGLRAVYLPGARGPHEAVLGFASGEKAVLFQGLEIHVNGQPLGDPRSGIVAVDGAPGRYRDENGAFSLNVRAWPVDGALKLHAEASDGRRITDLALGPADRVATHVYFGHGYAIRDPEPFRVHFGGHTLSSSHVGVDFDNGVSLLTASDVPPMYFDVNPRARRYALHTRYNATLTLLPGSHGALDCAIRYRPLYDKPAAPGVGAQAGRFVFDLWGGPYAEHLDLMRAAAAYGLDHILLTLHVWQRWGYDYRLPDIFPPNTELGSTQDLQALSAYCREHQIPWGLHDNYIDFYPDAEGFSYDHIAFTEGGRPVPAWLNESRDAQSYRWRPDRFLPFLQRNLDLIAPALRPTHSFVDVFTSLPPVEYYDREGVFHSALETRRHWNQAFDVIRESLEPPAITTSEAGHDQLTGHLDGADCQFLLLTPTPREHTLAIRCADWERVPWYDAVLHDRFILHGVGYSSRYQAGRPRSLHGIESDDYLSAEILTGHALMIDRPAGLAGAVRKYWLAQPWAQAVAMDRIEAVEFAGGDLHRLIIRWASGAEARVNRGREDWPTADRILPPYGFVAAAAASTSAVIRIANTIAEFSQTPDSLYVNSRTAFPRGPFAITPAQASIRDADRQSFRFHLDWAAAEPLPTNATVFVHFLDPARDARRHIAFQGDHRPELPTSQWNGRVRTGGHTIRLPENLPPGRYPAVVGLFTPGGNRFALLGHEFDDRRYLLGAIVLTDNSPPQWEPHDFTPPPSPRNPPETLVDFGPVVTDGAFRLADHGSYLQLSPLPNSPAIRVTLHANLCFPGRAVTSLHQVHRDPQAPPTPHPYTTHPNGVSFTTQPGAFSYRLETHGLSSLRPSKQ